MKRLKRVFILSHEWNVFAVLIIIIAVSLFSWWVVKIHLEKEWNARLTFEVEKVTSTITREIYGYGDALSDTKAYFQLSGVPTPRDFQNYIESSQILKRFPGMQGIAYSQIVQLDDVPALEKKMQAYGYPDFKYWPEGERSLHTAVTLIQPEDWRNRKVLGFDMYSDVIRKEAMDHAIEKNAPAITDPVYLVQDSNEKDRQQGFLIYLPVTKNLEIRGEKGEARDSLIGFTYAIVRIYRFFNGGFGVPEFYNERVNYRIETFDPKTNRLISIYERFPSKSVERPTAEISMEKELKIFDKTWKLHFEPLPHFFNWYERYVPILVALVTLIMLSVIFLALWSTQQFLKFNERHKESLAQISRNKTTEIVLFKKLNSILADLSSAIESNTLFEKFCVHLYDVFQIDDCVVFVREQKGQYERRFQKELDVFPAILEMPSDWEELPVDGIVNLSSGNVIGERFLSQADVRLREIVKRGHYYLMKVILHESGKKTSILVLVKGPADLLEINVKEYALTSIFGQFAMSYEKAILLRRAEDANLMKSSFLANMSHEIRTPLGVIVGFTEILAQDDLEPEDKMNIVNGVKRNGKELARLIDDILDISKVEAGKLHFEMAQVNLEGFVSEIKSVMDARANEKGIQFTTARLSNVPGYIITDDVRLKQILVNIAGNAIKFTENGSVKLLYRTHANEEGTEFLEFQVQDTGIGISEKNRENLFRPFSQGDVTTTRKYGGTGLGLALSKRLAELLGGDLFLLESSVGKGSTFCLRVPLKGVAVGNAYPLKFEPAATLESSLAQSRSNIDWSAMDLTNLLRNVSVLLVEDSVDNQEIYEHFLSSAGADVMIAEDGEKAINMAFQNQPDIILMDIQIPKLDGKEATKTLRQRGFTRPIVALTAHALNEEVRSCLAAGCNGQITKPVSGELLVQEVYFYLNHRG